MKLYITKRGCSVENTEEDGCNLPIPPYSGKQALFPLKFSRRSIEEPSLTTVSIVSKSLVTVSGKAMAAKLFLKRFLHIYRNEQNELLFTSLQ